MCGRTLWEMGQCCKLCWWRDCYFKSFSPVWSVGLMETKTFSVGYIFVHGWSPILFHYKNKNKVHTGKFSFLSSFAWHYLPTYKWHLHSKWCVYDKRRRNKCNPAPGTAKTQALKHLAFSWRLKCMSAKFTAFSLLPLFWHNPLNLFQVLMMHTCWHHHRHCQSPLPECTSDLVQSMIPQAIWAWCRAQQESCYVEESAGLNSFFLFFFFFTLQGLQRQHRMHGEASKRSGEVISITMLTPTKIPATWRTTYRNRGQTDAKICSTSHYHVNIYVVTNLNTLQS